MQRVLIALLSIALLTPTIVLADVQDECDRPEGANAAGALCYCITPEFEAVEAHVGSTSDCLFICAQNHTEGDESQVSIQVQCEVEGQLTAISVINSEEIEAGFDHTNEEPVDSPIVPRLNVKIPGLKFTDPTRVGGNIEVNFIGEYVEALYRWMIYAAAIVAVVLMMIGGLQWMLAGGNAAGVGKAKKRIADAITGLVLILAAYTIAFLVDPETTKFDALVIQIVPPVPFELRTGFLNQTEQTLENQYRTAKCPTSTELEAGVGFFTTGYYKPGYGEEGYGQDFLCNVAMQCSCPNGTTGKKSCSNSAGSWAPCVEFSESTPYCNATSSGAEPVALKTAATSSCLPLGTVFKVFGSTVPGADETIWTAQDTGGWIQGRRIDLFTGEGSEALQQAINASAEVTIRICPDNDPSKCPDAP